MKNIQLDITEIIEEYKISRGLNERQLGKHLVILHKKCRRGTPIAPTSEMSTVIRFMLSHSSNCH